jgi:CRP/FNR family cyclic AMP-dependent transcriptional regulator
MLNAAIDAHPFLGGLKPAHLQALKANALLMHYKEGEVIFRERDPANRFYLIRKGSVALESRPAEHEPVLIQTIGPGDVLGWSWLFPPYYWHFDARALEPTEAIFFYATRLREQCEQDSDLGYELMKRMAGVVIHRLQATRRHLLEARAGK